MKSHPTYATLATDLENDQLVEAVVNIDTDLLIPAPARPTAGAVTLHLRTFVLSDGGGAILLKDLAAQQVQQVPLGRCHHPDKWVVVVALKTSGWCQVPHSTS